MYCLMLVKQAERDLEKLSKKYRQHVGHAFDVLRENPNAGKRLQGDQRGQMSLRVGPYRIIYTIDRDIVTVTVLKVKQRQGAYK